MLCLFYDGNVPSKIRVLLTCVLDSWGYALGFEPKRSHFPPLNSGFVAYYSLRAKNRNATAIRPLSRSYLVTPFLDPKVIGLQSRFDYLIDPKLIIFQAFIFQVDVPKNT